MFEAPVVKGMLEFEWNLFIEDQRRVRELSLFNPKHSLTNNFEYFQKLRGESWIFKDNAIAFQNDQLIGGPHAFQSWAETEHGYESFRPLPLFETLAEEAYINHMNAKKVQHEDLQK